MAPEDPTHAADVPLVRQVVLDCPHPRTLAEFYRGLLDYEYRDGDEPPPDGEPDPLGDDWLVLRPRGADASAGRGMAFQRADPYEPPVWHSGPVPSSHQLQMLHLDMSVPDVAALARQRERALMLGATELFDRTDDPDEPLHVFADPAGHPFCVFVG
ncbi:VOC family protein [Solicola sp. PLA-1-18]|uniref:VOC family protein n=1 Tax=Solicola sp. PLA-1-18 TaxID=3380532 RepID=UPI003B7E2D0A